ncbi:MAG TPA: SDR family oxidoreductase [Anaeromyxobacteraceae bacterium]|nr:SDR family oxidoreductase [Anaeromyxobacteraceae bacterium]
MTERVVITGASRGIGLELARQHARLGDRLLATCRNPSEARALAALAAEHPGSVRIARLDHTDPPSIAAAAALAARELDRVDLLWTNAGVYPGSRGTVVAEGGLGTLRAEDGLSVLATNAVGAVLVAQGFMGLLRRGKRPRLVAVSSGYGSLALNRGTPYWYGASKAALNMLYRSIARDPAAAGVLVLLLSPGWTRTDMGGQRAPTPIGDCVAGMLRVADQAGPGDNGRFLDWRGDEVPW